MATTKKAATKPRKKATPAKRAAKQPEVESPAPAESIPAGSALFDLPTEAQQQAKVSAYATLKNAGLPIPQELALEVEALIAASQKAESERVQQAEEARTQEEKAIAEGNETGPLWIRNTYNAPFAFRLERQDEKKKRVELKPRGQRGDIFPLQEDDLQDANLRANLELGRIEVIGDGDAKDITSKQTHNMSRTHTPIALLRNEYGKEYAGNPLKVDAEFNSQGVVVAVLDESMGEQHQNMKWQSGQRANQGGLVRVGPEGQAQQAPEQTAQFIPTGGNPAIISSGWDNNAQAKIADDMARRKDGQGPGSTGIVSVTVEAPKKVA